jgi:hypothetical protein
MLHDPQDWSVVLHTRQHVFHDETDSENYHRTPMHLESVPSIAAAEVRVEDHLLVMEMGGVADLLLIDGGTALRSKVHISMP